MYISNDQQLDRLVQLIYDIYYDGDVSRDTALRLIVAQAKRTYEWESLEPKDKPTEVVEVPSQIVPSPPYEEER